MGEQKRILEAKHARVTRVIDKAHEYLIALCVNPKPYPTTAEYVTVAFALADVFETEAAKLRDSITGE